jgi:predicted MFS family arabinose efflux permease
MTLPADPSTGASGLPARRAVRFVVLVGVVSLFADMTYEGARSINGPFLAVLGASGATVGVIEGLGELVGYTLRLLSGLVADRTRRYWLVTILGYAFNVLVVPLLALVGSWEAAATLMVAERLGKAIRTPARDAMLSHATHVVGHGWGFGLHEALDQIGAVCGPLLVALVLAAAGDYRAGFAILAAPAALTILCVLIAWRLYPRPHDLEPVTPAADTRGFPRAYWIYLVAAVLVAAGFAGFPLIAFHFGRTRVVAPGTIPLLYAFAMGVDAIAALVFGRLFDRHGLGVLIGAIVVSAAFAPLVFLADAPIAAVLGMTAWGIGMGAQESILRAAIAGMVPRDRRGTAYGLFNALFGIAWFAGSAAMGVLYDRNLNGLVAFSLLAQAAAVPLIATASRLDARARPTRS